jgi:hypothetical protein
MKSNRPARPFGVPLVQLSTTARHQLTTHHQLPAFQQRNSKAARARRKRGQYRRMITIPGAQFRRLAELGYLERVDDPVAQVRALEAFLFDSLQ